MSTRQARKEETIHRILDAAVLEFAETGFEGARVDAIADLAGINKAMIYYHVGDKKALYTRVLSEVFGNTAARMAGNIQRAITPQAKIRAYIRSIHQALEIHPHMPRVMMREMASGGANLSDTVLDELTSIIGLVGKIIAQGKRLGEFNDFDPFTLHLMVMGAISYFQASHPIRLRHPAFSGSAPDADAAQSIADFLSTVERFILSALTGRYAWRDGDQVAGSNDTPQENGRTD